MSSFVFYSFSVIVCSGVFMLHYHLFVSRKAGYTFCRRYLMAAMLLSVVIPTLNVPLYHKYVKVEPTPQMVYKPSESLPLPESSAPVQITGNVITAVSNTESAAASADATPEPVLNRNNSLKIPGFIKWRLAVFGVYLIGVLISLGLILRSIIYISGIRNRSVITAKQGYTLAENADVKSPFSFLNTIFMGRGYSDSVRCQILSHETSHVQHHHSS